MIGPHVTLGPGTRLLGHVFLDGRTTLGAECTVFPFASIGTQTQDLKYAGGVTYVEIGDGTTLRESVTVNSGTAEGEVTRVGKRCHIMAYAHVAHACRVGDGVIMGNCTALAGEVQVEDNAIISALCGVHQFTRVGCMSMTGGMTKVAQDVPPYMLVEGNPPVVHGVNSVGLKRRNVAPRTVELLKQAYRLLYREGLATRAALDRIRAEVERCPEVEHLIEFVAASERGIIK